MTSSTASPIPQQTTPPRLSFARMQRLDGAAFAGTALTAVAALFAALTIVYWQPGVYLPETMQTGLRWLVVSFAHGYILARMVEATWDYSHGHTKLAGGHTGPIKVAPIRTKLHALLLSMPLWPTIWTAWEVNDPAVLLTANVAQRALVLALPLLVSAVTHTAIKASERFRDRLQQRQTDEDVQTSILEAAVRA